MNWKPFIAAFTTIFLAGLMLLAYPLFHEAYPFLQQNFRTYNSPLLAVDSIGIDTSFVKKDSVTVASVAQIDSPQVVLSYISPPKLKAYSGYEYLNSFLSSIETSERQIRIAYFGDSSIEGDLISQTVRDSLQRRFGGSGVGFMPITSKTSGFRRSIRHFYSKNWYHCYIGRKNTQAKRRGISGEYFLTSAEPKIDTIQIDSTGRDSVVITPPDYSFWVSYRPSKLFSTVKTFAGARLFYGTPNFNDTLNYDQTVGRVRVRTSDTDTFHALKYNSYVNQTQLFNQTTEKLTVNFEVPKSMPIYGVSLESESGVILDNFSSRGNMGPGLKYISEPVLRDFQKYMDYDLIILQFGLNVTDPDLKDLSWYKKDMIETIRHFQIAMPGVSILIIGPSDVARKIEGQMRTDPSVALISQSLQDAAMETHTAFFSIYEAMGGEGSMVNWVHNKRPKLANPDYTHFNFKGAEVVGNYILDYLLQEL